MELDAETREQLAAALDSALAKLKASMDDGPGGRDAILTPEESTMLYRVMTTPRWQR